MAGPAGRGPGNAPPPLPLCRRRRPVRSGASEPRDILPPAVLVPGCFRLRSLVKTAKTGRRLGSDPVPGSRPLGQNQNSPPNLPAPPAPALLQGGGARRRKRSHPGRSLPLQSRLLPGVSPEPHLTRIFCLRLTPPPPISHTECKIKIGKVQKRGGASGPSSHHVLKCKLKRQTRKQVAI